MTNRSAGQRLSLFSVAIVHMDMLTALDQLMPSAVLGNCMTLGEASTTITLASLLFSFLTSALGYAGMREGLSGMLLARWCGFGCHGSVLSACSADSASRIRCSPAP